MRKLTSLLCLLVVSIWASSCYDDTAIWDSVNDHEQRIKDLEARCNEMNANINSLQTIVNASLSGDYITDVSPVAEGGKEVGYIITFSKGGTITVYHGKDGADGKDGKDGEDGKDSGAPRLGISKDNDDNYYWTLNGEWLLDDNGDKIKAVGTDGKDGEDGANGIDGVTPQLKIVDDYWYISYDNGATWTVLSKAKGEDGKDGEDGGDSIFSDVYERGGYVYFVLADGNTYMIPTSLTAAGAALDIQFDVEQGVGIVPGTSIRVKYTITGAEGTTFVRSISADEEIAAIKPIDNTSGYIYLYCYDRFDGQDDPSRDETIADEIFGDVTEEDFYQSYLSILVIVSDSKGNQVVKALNFVEGILQSVDEAYITDAVAGSISTVITTNVRKGSYEITINDKAKEWISYVPTKAEVREDVLTFNVTENTGDKFRTAKITLINDLGQTLERFVIIQRSKIAGEVMAFADPKVKDICVSRYDKNLDGELTYEEAATATNVEGLFTYEKNIVSFDEFEHFTSVTEIPDRFFSNCTMLESVKLPEGITTICNYAFAECQSLKSITLPEGVTNRSEDYYSFGYGWFENCTSLEEVILPSTLKGLPTRGFSGCKSLKSITIPKGVSEIPEECFYNCQQLSQINYQTPITEIGSSAFAGCCSLKSFDLSSLKYLSSYAFEHSGLTTVTIPESITSIPSYAFRGCENLASVNMHDNVTEIGYAAFGQMEEYDNELSQYRYYSCINLKNIKLPSNLEHIGSVAFKGSGLEGEPIEGTSIKALIIPEKVTSIEYEAFYECPNLSAVKMMPSYPPTIGYNAFGNNGNCLIYVATEAVDTYKNSGRWYEYANWILPYDMMAISVSLEFEIAGEATYSDTDGCFNFPIALNVSGDSDKLVENNVIAVGFYAKPAKDYYYDSDEYYHGTYLNLAYADYQLKLNTYYFDEHAADYMAEAEYNIGAFLTLEDGTRLTFDNRKVKFVYDAKPSLELLGAIPVSSSSDGGYSNKVLYDIKMNISGGYWIEDYNLYSTEGIGEIYWSDYDSYKNDGITYKMLCWNYGLDVAEPYMTFNMYYLTRHYYEEYITDRIVLNEDAYDTMAAAYKSWVGVWNVTGANGVTFPISLEEYESNKSYVLRGWDGFELPFLVNYSAENNQLLIYGQDLGTFEFSDPDYNRGNIFLRGIASNGSFRHNNDLIATITRNVDGTLVMNGSISYDIDGAIRENLTMTFLLEYEAVPNYFYTLTEQMLYLPAVLTPYETAQTMSMRRGDRRLNFKKPTTPSLKEVKPMN